MSLLAAAWLLFQPISTAAGGACLEVSPGNPVRSVVVEQMTEHLATPPSQVLVCPEGRWQVRWPSYERVDEWRKSAQGRCRTRQGADAVELRRCRVSIEVTHPALPHGIRLGHDLPLSRVREVVEFLVDHLPPDQRISLIDFTTVRDGGAWSEKHYGYEVHTVRDGGGSGDVLQVYRDCMPSPCVWAHRKVSQWMS